MTTADERKRRTESVVLHDRYRLGDRDLLDVAAVSTLGAGGRVHVLPAEYMPESGEPVAARYRY